MAMAHFNNMPVESGNTLSERSMLRIPPPDVIASWPSPNYTDPVTRGNALLITNVVLQSLATIAVAGRLCSRLAKKWFGLDDALITIAYVLDIGMTAAIMMAKERYGWDRHAWDLPLNLLVPANKVAFAVKMLVGPITTLIRLSLLCFYYRLVKDSPVKWFRTVLHISTAYTISVGVTFVTLAIFECRPTQAYWTLPPMPAQCLDEGKVLLGAGVLNSVSDLLVTVLPIPVVMRLQMPLRHRIGVCVLLCLGVIVTIAGVVRIYYTWVSLIESWDESWRAYPLWIATSVEIHLGMICACAPAWKAMLQGPLKRLSTKISKYSHSSNKALNSRPSTAKRSLFNPLKSLPLFQHTRFDFEKTWRDPDEFGDRRPEKYPRTTVQTGGFRGADFEDSETAGTPTKQTLCITKTYSLDQRSIYLNEIPEIPPYWIYEGSSEISSPQKGQTDDKDPSSFV